MSEQNVAQLKARLKNLHRLSSIASLLGWDEQVNLPSGSAELRGEQSAAFGLLYQKESSQPEIGELLEALRKEDSLSPEDRCVVDNAWQDYLRSTRLPAKFLERKSIAHSRAFHAWAKSREASDFSQFAEHLQTNLDLAKEEVDHFGWEGDPYDYWVDQFDPGMTSAAISTLFEELSSGLVPLAAALDGKAANHPPKPLLNFPVEQQEAFLREVVTKLGFNWERGRLDRSLHPFCSGCGEDIRMTTRFNKDVPLDSLFSSIHETGHALYEQGLKREEVGNALGDDAGMGVHESQSRLWENQVSRSRPFWDYWEPRFRATFSEQLKDISGEELYLAINAVQPCLIRVDSDEIHYNLHIILRFTLEKALFRGDLKVQDLPAEWNRLSRELLQLDPPDDRHGVLQDVHWSGGAFGYFPSYCLGNMIAAQLWEKARSLFPDWEAQFRQGEFGFLLNWLRKEVHHRGRMVDAQSLPKIVCGEDLSPKALLRYLKERYEPLYE